MRSDLPTVAWFTWEQFQPLSPIHCTIRLYFFSYIILLTSLRGERGIFKMLSDGSAGLSVLKCAGNAHHMCLCVGEKPEYLCVGYLGVAMRKWVGVQNERRTGECTLGGALCGGGCIRVVLALGLLPPLEGHSELHLQTLEPTSSTS